MIALYVSLYIASVEPIKSSADQSFSTATGTVGTTGAGVVVSSCLTGVVVSSCLTGVVVSSCLAGVVVSSCLAGVVVSTVPGSTTGVVVSSTVASPNTPSSYTEIPYASAFGLHPVATTFTY